MLQTRSSPVDQYSTIADALSVLVEPGAVFEIRVPKAGRAGTVAGYFTHLDAAGKAASAWSGRAPGVYFTINAVNPVLLARGNNRLVEHAEHTAADADIVARRWLYVDVDPVRPAGIAATDTEHEGALDRAHQVRDFLIDQGVPPGAIISADSGGGGNLFVRVNLPNDEAALALVNGVLSALGAMFGDAATKIDKGVGNAARIARAPGTLNAKGDNMPERPHRIARLLDIPNTVEVCPRDVLERIAALAPAPARPARQDEQPYSGPAFDFDSWLANSGLGVARQKPWGQATLYELEECPWNPDHRRTARIVRFGNGALSAGCFHASCQGKGWQDLRDVVEGPDRQAHSWPHHEPSTPGHSGHAPSEGEGTAHLEPLRLTDTSNAELIAELYGNILRYDHKRGRFLIWASHRWKPDADGAIYRMAIDAARERYRSAASIEDLEQRKRVAAWAISSENRGRLDAAIAGVKNLHPIADSGQNWDVDPWLLGCPNGIVDLRTGQLRPGRPGDRITMSTGVPFAPEAKAPRWEQFQVEVFPKEDLRDWVYRALGYSLTGIVREQVFFFGHGRGANGKTAMFEAVSVALGDYAHVAPFSMFEAQYGTSIPNDLAALECRRFVTASETRPNARFNEARLKELAGNDQISARYLHHEFFTFKPGLKLWLRANHKPRVQDESDGLWRKVRLIPFDQKFEGKGADKDLADKLKAEAPGILAWLVRGALEWQKRGLEPVPDAVKSATESYRKEADTLADFFAAECVLCGQATVKAGV